MRIGITGLAALVGALAIFTTAGSTSADACFWKKGHGEGKVFGWKDRGDRVHGWKRGDRGDRVYGWKHGKHKMWRGDKHADARK